MKAMRSLFLVFLLCLGTVSCLHWMGWSQPALASCDPPPEPPKRK